MMKAETLLPHDLELKVLDQNITKREQIWLTQGQFEVLKTLANASGDTPDEWLHSAVIGGLESDIDLYFGTSKTIREKLFKMAGVKKYG
jgi:hypothetical protein